jgi:hypothetical protein
MFPIRKGIKNVDIAFAGRVDGMLPPRPIADYPRRRELETLVQDWFSSGLTKLTAKPREGVDGAEALAHLRYCMRSYEPKHEHKIEGVAFLINEWFEEFSATVKR